MYQRKKNRRWLLFLAAILMIVLMTTTAAALQNKTKEDCAHEWSLLRRTAPTCTQEGKVTWQCSLCGKKKTEKLPALGHEWNVCTVLKRPTCTEDGVTRCFCARDETHYKDDVIKATGHAWGKWQTIRARSIFQAGREKRTCTKCGFTEYRSIRPLFVNNGNESLNPFLSLEEKEQSDDSAMSFAPFMTRCLPIVAGFAIFIWIVNQL